MGSSHRLTTLNVSLPATMRSFVETQVEAKGYTSSSEYMRELIRRAQHDLAEDQQLEKQLLEGLDSGPLIKVTPAYWAKKRTELARRARGKTKSKR